MPKPIKKEDQFKGLTEDEIKKIKEKESFDKKELKLEKVKMQGVEIAQVGNFKGTPITIETFKNFIANLQNMVRIPVATLNHSPKQTDALNGFLKSANLGIIEKLKISGKSLFADFADMPKRFAELIELGTFKFKSIEFSHFVRHADGGVFKDVLTGVTFHGGADGSSAITTMSDFLEIVGLKSEDDIEQLKSIEQDELSTDEIESIDFTEKPTGGGDMSKVDIDKTEYESLLKSKDELASLKDADKENTTLKEEKEVLTKQVEEDKKFKEKVEADKVEALKVEAETYIEDQTKANKIKPKFKEMKVAEYIRLAGLETPEGLKLFKEEIETSQEVIDLGELKTNEDGTPIANGAQFKDYTDSDEKADEFIKAAMKAAGHAIDETMDPKVYCEFGFKSNVPGFDDPKAGGTE